MENRYWVGGTGNWSDAANHWALTSGGIPNAANLPTETCDVFIDTNSGFDTGGILTITSNAAYCHNFTCSSGHYYTISSPTVIPVFFVYGSFTLENGITWEFTGALQFFATIPGNTIDMAGVDLSIIEAIHWATTGTGEWTLLSDIIAGGGTCYSQLSSGTLNANNHNITLGGEFSSTDSTVRHIIMGSGTWNVGIWSIGGDNLTLDEDSSTIKCSYFNGGG